MVYNCPNNRVAVEVYEFLIFFLQVVECQSGSILVGHLDHNLYLA